MTQTSSREIISTRQRRLERLGRFGLTLHPEKTRLVDFRRPDRRPEGTQRERSFDMLGFTHYWGRSRKGRWVVQRKTARSRFTRTLRRFNEWCRNRHLPVAKQRTALNRKLRGRSSLHVWFTVCTPRSVCYTEEPDASIAHVRICGSRG